MKNLGTDYDLARAEVQGAADTFNKACGLTMAEDGCWYFVHDIKSGHIVIYPQSHVKARGCGQQVKWKFDAYGSKARTEYFH